MSKATGQRDAILARVEELKGKKKKNKDIEQAVKSINAAEWLLIPKKLKNVLEEYRK